MGMIGTPALADSTIASAIPCSMANGVVGAESRDSTGFLRKASLAAGNGLEPFQSDILLNPPEAEEH